MFLRVVIALRLRKKGMTSSWERHDDGLIPWEDVVKEHKFTHWCYALDILRL